MVFVLYFSVGPSVLDKGVNRKTNINVKMKDRNFDEKMCFSS